MEKLRLSDLAREPKTLADYFGNGGALIVDDSGTVVAEVPSAIEPLPDEEPDLTILDSDWLDS